MAVYFLRGNDTGLIKIGYTRDIRTRTTSVATAIIGGGQLIGYLPGGRDLEKHLHNSFAQHRRYGEWFTPDAEITAFIERFVLPGLPAEQTDKREKLRLREEAHVAEAAQLIDIIVRSTTDGLSSGPAMRREAVAGIAHAAGLPEGLLQAIEDNAIEQISAGTLSALRLMAGVSGHFASNDWDEAIGPRGMDRTGTDGGEE